MSSALKMSAPRLGVLLTLLCLCVVSVAAVLPQWTPLPVTGEVGDAKCNVEEVESANEHQLHEILNELTNTTYFRLFQVDLSRKCKFWNKPQDDPAREEPSCSTPAPEVDDAGFSSVGGGGGGSFLGGAGRGAMSSSSAAASSAEAPPTMCSLDLASKDPGEMNWAPPSTPVDRTISRQEDRAISAAEDAAGSDCADEDLPTFWMDMCPNLDLDGDGGASAEYVNLQLNPERWTGYNGSHVWSAIYEENCLRSAGSIDDMCYEERVLYRLLSGMHASVNIHIALKAKPPKRGVPGRADWSADPKRFMNHYGSHPDRLRNLHFSFVVLLRALRKAAPTLAGMDLRLGQDTAEDDKVEVLMRRLLDTHILSSCSAVFGAFDESLLFKEEAAERAAKAAAAAAAGVREAGGVGDGVGAAAVPTASLKSQFKGVFHNISEVMDCISCQKCKLHGKLQLLGLGTALKVLLLPEHLHATALSRSEVVALINTIAKFSHAILKAPELAAAYWAGDDVKKVGPGVGVGAAASGGGAAGTGTVGGVGVKGDGFPFGIDSSGSPPLSSASVGGVGVVVGGGGGGVVDVATMAWGLMDAAVGAASTLAREGTLSTGDENTIVDAAVSGDSRVLIIAQHYAAADPRRFAEHALRVIRSGPPPAMMTAAAAASSGGVGVGGEVDAVVVGGGLAGLTAALTLLDRGARVVLLEKEGYVGGNSQWASSGINGVDVANATNPDSVTAFTSDCEKSSLGGGEGAATGATIGATGGKGTGTAAGVTGGSGDVAPESVEHIPVLAAGSVETLEWLRTRVGVDLSRTGQLGGHSYPRTHRPASGMAGSTLVLALQKACDAYKKSGTLVVRKKTKADEVIIDDTTGAVRGVRWSSAAGSTKKRKGDITAAATTAATTEGVDMARAVILATGGFANDRDGEDSLLRRYAPAAVRFATTNTRGTTGDGHKMAFKIGAAAVDLANVQIHPTGFVDPADPSAQTKTLAAEILRGAGALLLTRDGRRFADELGTRDYVSGRMLAEAEAEAEAGGIAAGEGVSLDFVLLLNAAGAAEADKHVPLYTQKGLLTSFDSLKDVADWMDRELGGAKMKGKKSPQGSHTTTTTTTESTLRATLEAYNTAAAKGGGASDPLTNKTFFNNAPFRVDATGGGTFFAGRVTPVVHYTMGGVRVDALGRVVRAKDNTTTNNYPGEGGGGGSGDIIPGLYAAGELIGGVHGRNRLGGNALTECAVFGRIVGQDVPLGGRGGAAAGLNVVVGGGGSAGAGAGAGVGAPPAPGTAARRRPVTKTELAKHATEDDCWVAVYGEVYDFTDFLDDHPAGVEAIVKYGGSDGTAIFDSVHSRDMLDDFTPIGPLVD